MNVASRVPVKLPAAVASVRARAAGDAHGAAGPEASAVPPSGDVACVGAGSSGADDAARELAPLLESLLEAVADLDARRRQSLVELQELAVELAAAVAAQVVRTAIDRGQFGVEQLVRDAVDRLGCRQPVQIALHPDDLGRLQGVLDAAAQGALPELELIPDPTAPRGGCRASAGVRTIVADWRTHVDDLRALLLEELEHAQSERRSPAGADQRVRRFPDRRETA